MLTERAGLSSALPENKLQSRQKKTNFRITHPCSVSLIVVVVVVVDGEQSVYTILHRKLFGFYLQGMAYFLPCAL